MHLNIHCFLSVSIVAFVKDVCKPSVLMDGVLEGGNLQRYDDDI